MDLAPFPCAYCGTAGTYRPGRHGEDFRPYFSALKQGGYNQRISIECNWHDLPNEVDLALRVLREQWEFQYPQTGRE